MSNDLQKLLAAADAALKNNEVSRCLELLHSGLEQHASSVELLARLGIAHVLNFEYADAITILQRAATLEPEHPTVLYYLGAALRFEGDMKQALQVHDRLRELHPQLRNARYAAALTRTMMGLPEQALPEMEKLVAEDPKEGKARIGLARTLSCMGRFTEALYHFNLLLEEEPNYTDALLYKAEAAMHLQRTREWVESSRRAHQLSPGAPITHYQTHRVCLLEGDARGALEHLQHALKRHPSYVDARVALGNLLWLAGDLDSAQAELEHAATTASWDGKAVGMLAYFQVATGRGQPKLEPLEKAARIRPYAGLPYQLGRIYFETLKDPVSAERLLNLAVEHGPELVDAHRMLGELYTQQDRTGEALAHFRRIVELSPEHGVAWNGLAYCLGREGKTTEALEAYEQAARLLPGEVSVFQGYGAALLQAGEAERATSMLQRALELQPDSGPSLFILAIALEEAGRLQESLQVARKAEERLPQDENVRALLERLQGSAAR